MALGFTSHFSNSDKQFGSLILGNSDNEYETSGSVADSDNYNAVYGLLNADCCDSYDFSVSVNIDYSQYAGFVASGTETAGSVAFSGSFSDCGSSGSSSCSSFSGGSFSGGSFSGGGCSSFSSFTC